MCTRHVRAIVSTGVVAFVFAAAPSAEHSWGDWHWARTANPFTLKVGDNVTSAWDGYLQTAAAEWTVSQVLDLAVVPGRTRPKPCKATAGRIEVCNAEYGWTGWLGIATVWGSEGHITQATAKMNDTYFNHPTYNTAAWRRLVMCQEIAHDFGLDHQDEIFGNFNLGSCMDYTNDPDGGGAYGPSNVSPNQHDYDQLVTIYDHNDSTTTLSATLPNGTPAPEPNAWGRLVRSSRNGRVHIYELDLGNGTTIFTHVFWADLEGDSKHGR